MLYMITGTPGSGKSLRALWYIRDFLKEGRKVFTNIDGITLDVESLPDDWRDTPEGSVVVVDEAQLVWPSTGRPGVSQNEEIRAMELHRHTGHDIFMLTQHPTLIDSHIRKLVGRHEHLKRAFGGASASHLWSSHESFSVQDKKDRADADHFVWQFDKSLYPLYKSATIHTHKWKFPKKLRKYLIGLIICLLILFYVVPRVFSSGGMFTGNPVGDNPASSGLKLSTNNSLSNDSSLIQIDSDLPTNYQGCIWSDENCLCFDEEFNRVQVTFDECSLIVTTPLPIVINNRRGRS